VCPAATDSGYNPNPEPELLVLKSLKKKNTCFSLYTHLNTYVYISMYMGVPFYEASLRSRGPVWPLHKIAITNMVWCVAYNRRVGGGAYLAQ